RRQLGTVFREPGIIAKLPACRATGVFTPSYPRKAELRIRAPAGTHEAFRHTASSMTYGPQSGSLRWRRLAVQLLLRMAKPGIMLIPMKTLVSLVAAGVLEGTLMPAAFAQSELPASPSDRFNKPAQTAPTATPTTQ